MGAADPFARGRDGGRGGGGGGGGSEEQAEDFFISSLLSRTGVKGAKDSAAQEASLSASLLAFGLSSLFAISFWMSLNFGL